jgi:hypothetical protein
MVYVVLYIHTNKPDYSEVLGVFGKKDDAVAALLEIANYRETKGELTQYMAPCAEYDSFSELYELCLMRWN